MKIGIFGDSFGEKSPHAFETEESKAWPTYISEEFDTDNHCASGSSFYYSANLFLKTHNSYDKIIFLITIPGRLEITPALAKDIMPNRISNHDHAISMIEYYPNNRRIYQAAVDYFLYFQNFEQECFFQYAAIEKLRNTRKDNILFLPCFAGSVNGDERNNTELFQIASLDETNPILKQSGRFNDQRHCHFNPQNNIIFAKNIKNWIHTGVWNFNIKDYVRMNVD